MKTPSLRPWLLCACLLLLPALAACGEDRTSGNDDNNGDLGDGCLVASDCGGDLACVYLDPAGRNICTRECAADFDCDGGSSCVASNRGGWCVPDVFDGDNNAPNNVNNNPNNNPNNTPNNNPNNTPNNNPNNVNNNPNNTPNNNPAPCIGDASCGDGEICEAGDCITGCRDDASCGDGELCEDSRCAAGCRDDATCDDGEICEAQTCKPGCRANADCGDGERCEAMTCAPIPVCTPDALEPNNTAAAPSNLTASAMATACAGDEDWFRFTANAGDSVVFSLSFTHADGDLSLAVFAADGTSLLGESDTRGNAETVTLNATGGPLLARVRTQAAEGGSAYTLRATATAPPVNTCNDRFEPNDTRAAAMDIEPGDHTQLGVCTDDLDDWYRLAVEPLDTVLVSISFSDAESDIDLDLTDADGATLDSSSGVSDSETVEAQVRSGGFVYILVENYGGDDAAYTMNITIVPGPEPPSCEVDSAEPNNASLAATDLSAPLEGLAVCEGDEDWFVIFPEEPGVTVTVTAGFDATFGDVDLELLDADGTTVLDASAASTTTTTVEALATTGDPLYVRAVLGDGVVAQYDLQATQRFAPNCTDVFESNNTREAATAITPGTYTRLAVCPSTDTNDYYQINARGGVPLTVTLRFIDAIADIDLAIQDADGVVLRSSTSGTDDEMLTYTPTTDAFLYIRVYHFSGSPNSYEMTIEGETFTFECAQIDVEPNNSIVTATLVAPGQHSGSLCPGDTDLYALDAFAGEQLTATLEQVDGAGNLSLTLLDANGTTLRTVDTAATTETLVYRFSTDGAAYLRVQGRSVVNAFYNLELTLRAPTPGDPCFDRFEPNSTEATAFPLTPDSYLDLDLCATDDPNDYYSVELLAGQVITVEILFSDNDADLDLSLRRPGGTTSLASSTSTTDDERFTWTADVAGTYIIRAYVFNASGDSAYDLNITVQ